jgi:hypothetical protein
MTIMLTSSLFIWTAAALLAVALSDDDDARNGSYVCFRGATGSLMHHAWV